MFGQGGSANHDLANAVAVTEEGFVVLAGTTWGDWNGTNKGDSDFAACKLDINGNLLWKWQASRVVGLCAGSIEIYARNVTVCQAIV